MLRQLSCLMLVATALACAPGAFADAGSRDADVIASAQASTEAATSASSVARIAAPAPTVTEPKMKKHHKKDAASESGFSPVLWVGSAALGVALLGAAAFVLRLRRRGHPGRIAGEVW